MRYMVIVKASKESEAGAMPTEQMLTDMGNYNEELVKAGVLLAMDGLHPSSKGARVRFSGKQRTVIGGTFSETKELVVDFWLWQVRSREEAIELAQARAFRRQHRSGAAPGFRVGRLRRRTHARTPRTGKAPAGRSRRKASLTSPTHQENREEIQT